jgi:hypothetical protein
MSDHSEITIQRSKHDKQNPYVMISRDMFHDPSISLSAKGLLGYLLSLPNDWKIYHSQLQRALNCGECALNSSLKELLDQGYATRTRTRNDKGLFNPYTYEICEFKIIHPNLIIQPGLSSLDNQALLSIESPTETTKETTTTKEKDAAVSFSPPKKENRPPTEGFFPIYDCLKSIDIPIPDKEEITKAYSEAEATSAVAWATHPTTKINKTLQQAIKWACKNQPKVPKEPIEVSIENESYAKEIEKVAKVPENTYFYVLSSKVEVGYKTGFVMPVEISFFNKGFKEFILETLKKFNIKIE